MVLAAATKAYTKVFGSRNERVVKSYLRRVGQINALEPTIRGLSDAQLRARTAEFQDQIKQGKALADLQPDALAVAREVMDRAVGIRSIFNPDHRFDPAALPPDARRHYDAAAAQIAATPPALVLGCPQHPGVHHQWPQVPGWMQVELPNELYAAVRTLYPQSRPPFRARPFDVQLIGGMVLAEGKISEMKTGEGKTIVAPLACYLACLEGLQCYVVTVNDYLVQRDRDWVFPFYHWLGLTVGAIHPYHMQPPEAKTQAYHCNVVYGTNSEFGFDYLRDNMKLTTAEQVQKHRDFCIIDEVDSILIDEARTPLIISGPAHDDAPRYKEADALARHLVQMQRQWDAADEKVQQATMKIKALEGDARNARDKAAIPALQEERKRLLSDELPKLTEQRDRFTQYYEVEREKKQVHLTHDGIAEAQKKANIGSFYVGANIDMPHLLENALRAHVVYRRDHEYVVDGQEVVIVDEFTGRKMIGRQWSDGLHQAVEAKEGVKIKQETQTLATVTIQNFFKLFKRLAGMTGTALTEATEFHEIYKLDVVSIPTNVPVVRTDRDDLIFLSEKDKWGAILDEIKRVHDIGRPVLVGTTSVEASEMLSQRLTKKHGIQHAVLNAKQHEREAQTVAHAGELGAVMIATNMAGRGTDIKLTPIDRTALLTHWQRRDLLPAHAHPAMPDEQVVTLVYRHLARTLLDLKGKDAEAVSDSEIRLRLLRHWVKEFGPSVGWLDFHWWHAHRWFGTPPWHDPVFAEAMNEAQCLAVLDRVPEMMLHRLEVYPGIEAMGGLHIVGTERHESRRIDNQLRGRAGRQGDRGSSRFFISLEDPLMKLFAGKVTLTALSKLGMKEGDAIEHRWITGSVERAQRKVEERNYEIRKNLLEYDEVMEVQRGFFYGVRQEVLEGRRIARVIFDYIGDAVADAVGQYLHPQYARNQAAEWCRQTLGVFIEPHKLFLDDLAELQKTVRAEAYAEARTTIEVTLGEYMSNEVLPEDYDLRGLQQWAMSAFSVDLKQNQLRAMNVDEVSQTLVAAAHEQIDRKDLSGLAKFMDKQYGLRDLVAWAQGKFGVSVDPESLTGRQPEQVEEALLEEARTVYRRRELTYPIEFTLEMCFAAAQQQPQQAAEHLVRWARQRYDVEWSVDDITRKTGDELHKELVAAAEEWLEKGGVDEAAAELLQGSPGDAELTALLRERFGAAVEEDEVKATAADPAARRALVAEKVRGLLRTELTQLERFVLLQILDAGWKDHLYFMDQLKDSIGLRGFAEKDPRIEYKREGSRLFNEMQRVVRDRVTDLIFRAKLSTGGQPQPQRNVYAKQQATQAEAAGALEAAPAPPGDPSAAPRAGGGEGGDGEPDRHLSRHERRARAALQRKGGNTKGPKRR